MSQEIAKVEISLRRDELRDLTWHVHAEDSTGVSADIAGGPFFLDSSAKQELQNSLMLLLQGHGIRQMLGNHDPVPILNPTWEVPE